MFMGERVTVGGFRPSMLPKVVSSGSCLIHGRSANGRIEWKDANARTLKALEEAEAG